jgi:hypothetical protein
MEVLDRGDIDRTPNFATHRSWLPVVTSIWQKWPHWKVNCSMGLLDYF